MSALVFYLANRSCSKFKFELEPKEFEFLKVWIMEKLFSISLWPWAGILAEAQPAKASFLSHAQPLMAQPQADSTQPASTADQSDRRVQTREANLTQ
jgi:hypothetical protein